MIYYDFRRGLTQKKCVDQLTSTFGDEAPSKTTVYRWFSEFNCGRSMRTDEFKEERTSRSQAVVVPQNIDAVRELIMQDRYVTYPEIKTSVGIITGWVFRDEPNPTKVIHAKGTLKQMVACFFGINGHVTLENRKTVNSEWYTTICLPEVFEEMRKNNRQRRIILHHDNASCHTSAETTRFFEGQKIKLTGQQPRFGTQRFLFIPKWEK
ncbi:hypothetical protein EVAR_14417_1 [Eumeta japonica]|uniref:Mos1 transposase HTH domain-containing protein n=1 Tax=Eumeta variegata TaxID=151549 RepID=A0A4C1TXA6_EUMVA|nr:hypothetical protein EVAR_14417_1 [Eumeta japonica]